MKTKLTTLTLTAAMVTLIMGLNSQAQTVPVGVDNFIRAETDLYFGNMMKGVGVGKFSHRREPADGVTSYKLVVKDVPVDAFWSISVYNAKGYFEKNPENAYSVNSVTGKKGADGSVVIQFGGKDDKTANYLPIMKGWNCAVRLYRPRKEILDGTWKFPEPQPMK